MDSTRFGPLPPHLAALCAPTELDQDTDTQGRTAWLCAELAGHNDLRPWAHSTRSKVAFWVRRLRDAINYARHGASYRPGGTVAVLLACQEAYAWSELGAEAESLSALARAEDAQDAVNGEAEIGGSFTCRPARRMPQPSNSASAALRTPFTLPTMPWRSCPNNQSGPTAPKPDPHRSGRRTPRRRRSGGRGRHTLLGRRSSLCGAGQRCDPDSAADNLSGAMPSVTLSSWVPTTDSSSSCSAPGLPGGAVNHSRRCRPSSLRRL